MPLGEGVQCAHRAGDGKMAMVGRLRDSLGVAMASGHDGVGRPQKKASVRPDSPLDMTITAYIDESGHSGADLYDINQPILTSAAVWLDEIQVGTLASTVAGLRKAHRLPLGGELKGAKLLKTIRGRHFVREILKSITALQAPISVVAFQKLYMAAGVVVEDCADYVYNPAFDQRWTWDTRLTEPLIEAILDASDPAALMRLWSIRREDDGNALKQAYTSYLFGLSLSLDDALAEHARWMMKVNFDDLWSAIDGARKLGSDYSPNLSAFNALLHGMDQQAQNLHLAEVCLLHDTQQQFQTLFTRWWDVISHANVRSFHYPSGNGLKFPTDRLKAIAFANSNDHLGIQLADILAAATRVALEEHVEGTGDRSAPYLPALKNLLRSPLAGGVFPFVMGTNSWKPDVLTFLLAPPT